MKPHTLSPPPWASAAHRPASTTVSLYSKLKRGPLAIIHPDFGRIDTSHWYNTSILKEIEIFIFDLLCFLEFVVVVIFLWVLWALIYVLAGPNPKLRIDFLDGFAISWIGYRSKNDLPDLVGLGDEFRPNPTWPSPCTPLVLVVLLLFWQKVRRLYW